MDRRDDQGALVFSATILGAPVTKKNHSRIIAVHGRPMIIPSKPYLSWLSECEAQISPLAHPVECPVYCRAWIYRVANRGDAVNYYQAIADMLEHCGVVKNDSYIVHWDGSRILKDTKAPRIEIALYTVENS